VEDLRDTVRELKARADKITEEFRTRTAKEALRHQSALSALNDEWTRTSSAAEAALAQGKQRGIERHQALKRRIDEAFQASKEQAIKRVEGKTGSRRYEMQRKTLQAERDREAGIAAANNEAQDLRTELATVEQELAAAERSAQLAFRGYPRLKRAFLSAYNDAHAPSGIDRRELLSRAKADTTDGQKAMAELKGLFLLRTFRFVWIWVIFAIAIFPGILLLLGGSATAIDTRRGEYAAAAASGALLLALLLRVVAFRASKSKAAAIAAHLSQARRAHDACLETIQTHLEAETTRL